MGPGEVEGQLCPTCEAMDRSAHAERQLGIELGGNGWAALLGEDADPDDEWCAHEEIEKRARVESGSGVEGDASVTAPAKQQQVTDTAVEAAGPEAQAGAHALPAYAEGPLPDSLLPRLTPPVAFEPLPPLRETVAAVSRSKLAEQEIARAVDHAQLEDSGTYMGWHRQFELELAPDARTCRAWCIEHGTYHSAPNLLELRELLDEMDPAEGDAEVGEDFSRAAREDR